MDKFKSDDSDSPTVSVIIPTYNRTSLLIEAVQSVLSQSYNDLECIIVDDGSEEDTASVIDQSIDPRIKYVEHNQNKGASAARNTGIEQAQGEFIAFLDDDDEWMPEKLEKQVELMRRRSDDFGLVYCWMDYYEYPDNKYKKVRPTLSGNIFEEMLDRQRIGNSSTLLVRSEVIDRIGGFDESLPRGNDGDFIRRVARKYKIDYVPKVLVKYYTGHGNKRITNKSKEGIENHIHGTEVKFEKFNVYRYPRRAARLHGDLGYHYLKMTDWKTGLHHFESALTTAPYEPRVYLWIFRSVRDVIKDNLPYDQ